MFARVSEYLPVGVPGPHRRQEISGLKYSFQSTCLECVVLIVSSESSTSSSYQGLAAAEKDPIWDRDASVSKCVHVLVWVYLLMDLSSAITHSQIQLTNSMNIFFY